MKKREKKREKRRVKGLKSVLAGIAVILWGAILVATISLEYNESVTEVASQYVERSFEDTRCINVVAAILAGYRLYDTLGEATVLFAAILGVTMLLGRKYHRPEEKVKQLDHLYGGSFYGDVYHR